MGVEHRVFITKKKKHSGDAWTFLWLCLPLQVDCNNYIRLLEFLGDGRIYVCGTYAFDPHCAFLVSMFVTVMVEVKKTSLYALAGECPFISAGFTLSFKVFLVSCFYIQSRPNVLRMTPILTNANCYYKHLSTNFSIFWYIYVNLYFWPSL